MDIKIYIDNQLMDLPSNPRDLNLKFNREFLDLQNPEKRGGDWSYTIKFPKTKNNNQIFSNINAINVNEKFYLQQDYKVNVYVNGTDINEGVFKIKEISELYYEGNITSGSVSWAKELSKKNLNQLTNYDGSPWTAEFAGVNTGATQYSLGWYSGATYQNSDIAFPLISRGTFFNGTVLDDPLAIFWDSLSFVDIPPSPFRLKIIKKIFEGIGWSVDSPLFSNPEHQKVVIPFTTNDEYIWNYARLIDNEGSGSTAQSIVSVLTNTFDCQNTTTFDDKYFAGAYIDNSTIIRNPANSLIRPTITKLNGTTTTISAHKTKGNAEYDIYFKINNFTYSTFGNYFTGSNYITPASGNIVKAGVVLFLDEAINGSTPTDEQICFNIGQWSFGQSQSIDDSRIICYYDLVQSTVSSPVFAQPFDSTANIVVNSNPSVLYNSPSFDGDDWSVNSTGDLEIFISGLTLPSNVQVKAMFVAPIYTFTSPSQADVRFTNFDIDDCRWIFSATNQSNYSIDIAQNLPEINQLDFVKSWVVENNLFITTVPENKLVRFDSFNDFFLPNTFGIEDIEFDTNNGEPFSKPIDLPRTIKFEYSNDESDALLIYDKNYGNLEIENDNVYTEGIKSIKSLFSATKQREFHNYARAGVNSWSPVILSSIAGVAEYTNFDNSNVHWSFSNSPRILKLNDYVSTNISGITYLLQLQVDGIRTVLYNTIFEDEREGYLNLCFNGDNGIYSENYERFLSEIGDSDIIVCNAKISAHDFNRMIPNTPIIVNGVSYFLNAIKNFDPINKWNSVTKIELIRKFTN